MVKEEIAAGLKNAIERGESLQKAMQSFINAGYNAKEVQRVASGTRMGVTGVMQQNELGLEKNGDYNLQEAPEKQTTEKNTKFPWKIIILAIVLMVLAGILGLIFFLYLD